MAGSGFFADSYDLFITDGVTNILKDLGPVNKVVQQWVTPDGLQPLSPLVSYASFLCPALDASCGPLYQPGLTSNSSAWEPNGSFNSQMMPLYQQQTGELKNSVNNAALVGSILGQLFFGISADLFGRKWNFVITSALIILGALGSATSAAGQSVVSPLAANGLWDGTGAQPTGIVDNVYAQLVIWRAILGFGVGGEYPLASTITSEGSSAASRGVAVLSIFSMQGIGKLTAAITNYALVSSLQYYGGPWTADATWRFALAFGCLLNILTLYFRVHMHETKIYDKQRAREGQTISSEVDSVVVVKNPVAALSPEPTGGSSAIDAGTATTHTAAMLAAVVPPKPLPWRVSLAVLREYYWTLIGTASTWFLIDVTFYGQSLMNTTVVNNAVGGVNGISNSVDKLRYSLLSTVWIMLIALPGYWVAIALIDRQGRWWMQMSGFCASAVCFALLAGAYTQLISAPGGFIVVYGLTYFFANYGPNSTTFLMPVEVFPTRARATAHGISAACGKIGATVGSIGLLSLYNSFCKSSLDANGAPNCSAPGAVQAESDAGVRAVMAVCVAVSLLGAVMTAIFVRESSGRTLEEVDAGSSVLRAHDAERAAAGAVAAVFSDAPRIGDDRSAAPHSASFRSPKAMTYAAVDSSHVFFSTPTTARPTPQSPLLLSQRT